jgi:hypothetical protein
MSKESRFKIESKGMFTSFLFYLIVGIVFLALLPLSNFPPHIGIMGIFSLVTAYGLLMKRNWSIWFIIIMLLVSATFSIYMSYIFLWTNPLLSTIMVAYFVLSLIFTAYTVTKRNTLES